MLSIGWMRILRETHRKYFPGWSHGMTMSLITSMQILDFRKQDGISPEAFLARRMNAYQAYYEFMPSRGRGLFLRVRT